MNLRDAVSALLKGGGEMGRRHMKIGVLNKGDKVLNVTSDFVAVRRKNGEVDILPLIKDEAGWRVETENIVTIGFGENVVFMESGQGFQIVNF